MLRERTREVYRTIKNFTGKAQIPSLQQVEMTDKAGSTCILMEKYNMEQAITNENMQKYYQTETT